MSEERLVKERDFYMKRCGDLGRQVFSLGEDLSRARSDTRRAATAAKLIRQAYLSINEDDKPADVASKVLQVIISNINVDRAVIWQIRDGEWTVVGALGTPSEAEDSLTIDPREVDEFTFTTAAVTPDTTTALAVVAALGYPYVVWSFQADQKMAIALGRNTEDMRLRPAFDEADHEMVSSALNVYCDLRRRKLAEAELDKANEGLRQLVDASKRFVPSDFLEVLGRESIVDVRPGDETSESMTVLFSDVRGFTPLSESMPPGELFRFVNRYLAEVLVPIHEHGGFVDKFIGDAIMALFRDPDAAVLAAIGMFRSLEAFNSRNEQTIRIGVGLHTGPLILGTLGNSASLQCTVIADAVNLASRLEGMTKQLGCSLLISEETLVSAKLCDKIATRCVGDFAVIGKTEPTALYQVIDAEDAEHGQAILKALEPFESGRAAWNEGDLNLAQTHFAEALAVNPHDALTKMYLGRCWGHLASGDVNGAWTSVLKMTSK